MWAAEVEGSAYTPCNYHSKTIPPSQHNSISFSNSGHARSWGGGGGGRGYQYCRPTSAVNGDVITEVHSPSPHFKTAPLR